VLAAGGHAVATLSGADYTTDVRDSPNGSRLAKRRIERGARVSIAELRSGWANITWTSTPATAEGTAGAAQSGWVQQFLLEPR